MHRTGAPRRERWTEARAREVLGALRASGLSMRAFAAQQGLRAQRLAWWRARLGTWERAPAAPKLVPAVIRGTPAGTVRVAVRVEGVVVEAESADALPTAWLAALASALGGRR